MNWEAVGAIAELAGAIGVILSLIYLASQIRQNTRSLQASTFQSMHDSAVQRLLAVADNDGLADRYLQGMQDPSSLHGRERLQLDQFLQAMLRGFENYYYQHQKGLLEQELWVGYRESIRAAVSPPGFPPWWSRARHMFSRNFAELIDAIIEAPKLPPA
jgi:hypothetical protein